MFFLALTATHLNAAGCIDEQEQCFKVAVTSHEGQPLSDMVVYLEALSGQTLPKTAKTVVIDQHNKSFSPYISVIQTNGTVNFSNKDDITHHIYSTNNINKFSFKVRAGETNSSILFKQPTDIAMGCNIHDWMSGYLLVVDTPYFTKTDGNGHAQFSLVESGLYRVVVWHPQMNEANNRLFVERNITNDQSVKLELTKKMADIPIQQDAEDFDFLSEYE